MSWIAQTKDVSKEEVAQAYSKLKHLKYPVKAISNAMPRVKKLNNFSPTTKQKLQGMLERSLNAYRQVRGDGNCFFRAFAFTYITNVNSNKLAQIFAHVGEVSLQTCALQSIPKDFRPFYKDHLLKAIILEYWQKDYEFFYKNNGQDFRRGLARMLTEYPFFDFIIILYFRALCLSIFKAKKSEYKEFLNGTEQIDISTYGAESESLVIGLISKYLSTNIYIYEVRKDEIVPYQYRNLRGSARLKNDVHLLFYDNHYDLLEDNPNCLSEYNDEKMEEVEYYSDISLHYIKGICVECEKGVQISQETGLCLACYNKSLQNLQNFKKDKLIEGICASCNRRSRKVSQQLMICQDCLQSMQYSKEKSKIYGSNDSEDQKHRTESGKTLKCKKCGFYKLEDDCKNGICFDCLFESREGSDKPSFGSKIEQSKVKPSKFDSAINGQSMVGSSSISIPSLSGRLESRISRDNRQLEEHQQSHGPATTTKAQIFLKTGQLVHCEQCANVNPSMHRHEKDHEASHQASGSIIKQSKTGSIISQKSQVSREDNRNTPCGMCGKFDAFFPLVGGACRKCIGAKKP